MGVVSSKKGKLCLRFFVAVALFSLFSLSVSASHLDSYPASSLVLITSASYFVGNSSAEDVFPLVNESGDGLWASIPAGDFVRVSFERPLTSSNDITLVARSSSSSVRVFLPGTKEEVAHFPNISEEGGTYKVLLPSLGSRSSAEFDLLVEEAPVEIDLITDPDVTACGTLSASGTHTLTQNISGSGTCITIGLDNITLDCAGCRIGDCSNRGSSARCFGEGDVA